MTVEEKPWFLRVEFWTPIIGAVGLVVLELTGVSLPTEALVTVIVLIGTIVWGAVSHRNKVMEASVDVYLADKQYEAARLSVTGIPKDYK